MTPYSSTTIANWFIDQARSVKKYELTPLKLQKLVYIAHGWNLALTDKPLINEDVQAWQYGPVVPNIYHRLKHYGKEQITDNILEIDDSGLEIPRVPLDDEFTNQLLHKIWDVYGSYDGVRLSQLTHAADTPWSYQWEKMQKTGLQQSAIPIDDVKRYYKKLAELP